MMQVERFAIEGLALIRPRIFTDERGRFLETWSQRGFDEAIGPQRFVQDNESTSAKGVIRGLHLQIDPHAQGKLVRVARGSVIDICLDTRPGSPTRGKHVSVRLNATDAAMLWIPPGFAHGFAALEEGTVLQYKCTAPYSPAAERTIRWDDPALGIDWGVADPIISAKDRAGMPFDSPWNEAR